MAQLPNLTRQEFFSRLQLLRTVDPITDQAYKKVEEQRWRDRSGDNPHGNPWHVSFHASQFPGDDPMACPRKALYRMMDLPNAEPFRRRSRAVISAGKAAEIDLVQTWHEAGILISAPPTEEIQTGFEYPEAWLTGSVDSVLQPEGWTRPLPVEVKTKYQRDIDEMKLGKKGPDAAHISQLKVQLALVAHFQEEYWPGLDPVTHGYLYYLSRDNPSITAEFRVDLDKRFFEVGIERLKQWRLMFEEDVLPEISPSKKHPMGWRWSYQPCQWCDFKKTCQLDFKQGTKNLSDSVGINRAKLVDPEYDPESARLRVLARWQDKGNKNKDKGEFIVNG